MCHQMTFNFGTATTNLVPSAARSAFCFITNSLGARRDGIVITDVSEEEQNWDWNGANTREIDQMGDSLKSAFAEVPPFALILSASVT